MRILQISHRNHVRGGSDAVFMATCRLLRDASHEVVPFCMASPENEPSPWSEHFPRGADSGRAPLRDTARYFFNAQARRNLNKLLEAAGSFDVAHLHIYHGKQTPAILPVLRRAGIPVLQTLHEYKLACPVYTLQRGDRPCEKCVRGTALNCLRHRCKDGSLLRSAVMTAEYYTARALGDVRLVDRFLCVSDFQRQVMQRAGLPADRLFTLHNFVDTSSAGPPPQQGDHLLYIGRIERLKGIDTLIDAARHTGARLVIAGDGGWRAAMLERIRGQDNIEYLGFQSGPALTRLVASARAVVVPSRWFENCPMSVLEAKALGRPVIAARIGGMPELVREGIDGFLFEPGSVESLVQALDALKAADPVSLSRDAAQDARARFSGRAHLRALLGHYRDAAATRTCGQWQPA